MTDRIQTTFFQRHRRSTIALTLAAAAVLAILALLAWPRGETPEASPSPAATAESSAFERPAGWDPDRPAVHLTPERNWMNDPQRPFLLDGLWHYYYLYNADHPDGNGTAWYHATSTDLVHWTDHGVAIEKYTNGLGDIWTGTAVVDRENTAGFGEDAVVAVVTQQTDGVQRQSLFVSLDGGYSFEPYDGNPVMDNPGVRDFRDPRVLWDEEHGQWVMALAEGGKIGFYTSPDLKAWTYRSGFETADLGVLECPDLFPMTVDGDPARVRWVLAAGANGSSEGMTTGTAYWVGDWDGETFRADGSHQWLDHGADYYAAVTWDDPRLPADQRLSQRYGIGWLNNWAYAGDTPGTQWQGGADSIVRSIRLVSGADGRASLASSPVDALSRLEGARRELAPQTLAADRPLALPASGSDAYRVRVTLDAADSDGGEVRLHIPRGGTAFTTVGYDFGAQSAFVARDADAIAEDMPDTYRAVRSAPAPSAEGTVDLDIVVDVGSVEVFVNGGRASLSMIAAGGEAREGVRVEAVDRSVRVIEASVTPLKVAAIQRSSGTR
ncbi:glycoside hydrolase family 32 protein [Microbacterium sp. BK668]|uniref:glycoside hydrolase family 32 protein n=1 Tax=Microbacterium sp. BK668 TaxID=2512118 RepID=UPI00105F91AB|nr:glycoside hydrolase family 32 protein [Microbacterium sp. BK668]TDN91641.1 levanbiose-producing levanase [Microbacterium sp. BK668]